MDTYLAIASRRETRRYSDRPIDTDARRRILEAGRIAGSSANKQQWRFIVVDSEDKRARLADLVYTATNVQGAKLIVAVVGHGKGPTSFDAGRAAQNMLLAAHNEGIGASPNGMPDRGAVAELLGLHAGEEPVIVLTFGYPERAVDPEGRSPQEWIARANRKDFDEVVETR